MPQPFSEEKRLQWKEKILEQRESGLSIESWCRKNNIAVHTFHYWRQKHFPKPTLDRSSFSEISSKNMRNAPVSKGAGITLEYQGIHLHLEKQFDTSALKQCLAVLKEGAC